MVDVIIFDLGGTLYRSDNAVSKGNKARLNKMKEMGFQIKQEEYNELAKKTAEIFDEKYSGTIKRFESGRFSDIFFDLLGKEVSWQTKEKLDEAFFEKWLKNQKLKENAEEVLKFCEEKNFRMAVISNGNEEMTNRIKRDGIDHYFEEVIYSVDVGAEKSDMEPFYVLLEKMDVKPEKCLMIGNRLDEDIQAKKIGMKTVLINDNNDKHQSNTNIEPDYTMENIEELKNIIKKL